MALSPLIAAMLAAALVSAPAGEACFADVLERSEVEGICITSLPTQSQGMLMLGSRILRAGDVLTSEQAENVLFLPGSGEVQVEYLPITPDGVGTPVVLTLKQRENQPPQVRDAALETYKNLPNTGRLPAKDPEGQTMTYTLVRSPRRGNVVLHDDGTFTYTPNENKVGIDSFTFTATDAAGSVSGEGTVTITILKPSDSTLYTDTLGESCRFEAEWMKNTGIFRGENLAGRDCFQPGKEVTQGEFLVMLIKTLDIPVDETLESAGYADAPAWLRPYLAAALRAGLTTGLPDGRMEPEKPVTGAEVAVLLGNALDFTPEDTAAFAPDSPQWSQAALAALADRGIYLGEGVLTRSDVARLLYRVYKMA